MNSVGSALRTGLQIVIARWLLAGARDSRQHAQPHCGLDHATDRFVPSTANAKQ